MLSHTWFLYYVNTQTFKHWKQAHLCQVNIFIVYGFLHIVPIIWGVHKTIREWVLTKHTI